MELSLSCDIKQVSGLEVDPAIPIRTRVPETYSEDFLTTSCDSAVATIFDAELSGPLFKLRIDWFRAMI